MIKRISNYIKKNNGLFNAIEVLFKNMRKHGIKDIFIRIFLRNHYSDKQYNNWIKKYDRPYTKEHIEMMIHTFTIQPKISVLIPVYNVAIEYLLECVQSVQNQYYQNWELILVDDCSTDEHIKPMLDEFSASDSRIVAIFREENGHISAATNTALKSATGEYIALLDNDDIIKPEALLEMVQMINLHPDADMLYSDEDKINEDGTIRSGAFFKPDWSPDAFWGHMYICHLGVYRTSIAKKIDGERLGYEGAQDYDFVLRFTEETQNIYHVPKILYHWRMIPTSTASGADNKNYAFSASIRAKEDALKRRGYKARLELNNNIQSTNVVFEPDESDYVSIIIPTKNHGEDVVKCINSIFNKSSWKNFEIILVDNGSDDEISLSIFNQLIIEHNNIKILKLPIPFNYSKLNNEAVKISRGNLLLFLNNDTEIITSDWLERMIGQAKLPYTGAVGAKLLYADDTIQHAGIIKYEQGPGHAFLGYDREDIGYFARLILNYNYAAVTGAVLMIEKNKFIQTGGFDQDNLSIAYNDVDLCFTLLSLGYHNVVRTDVEIYHYESKSRGYEDTPEKIQRFKIEQAFLNNKWKDTFKHGDPYYNNNLTPEFSDFSFKK